MIQISYTGRSSSVIAYADKVNVQKGKLSRYLKSGKHPSSSFRDDHLRSQLMKFLPKRFRLQCSSSADESGMKRPLRVRLFRRIRAILAWMMIAVIVTVVVAVVARLNGSRRRNRRRNG